MKKLMPLLILLTMALSLTVSASDEGVVSMNAHELLLSLEVTLTSNVTINPNAIGTEEDIISGTALKIKNNTFIDIDAYIADIDSPYNSLFVEYSDNSIIWKNLGHTDTLKYIAFSAESKDIIPNQEVLLGSIPNRGGGA